MNKEKYQIKRKSDFLRLTIILHDLKCFDEELQEVPENTKSLAKKMRNTRNVFISLYNLKESIRSIKIDMDDDFTSKTRSLVRKLDFIVHFRNKGVGHLDNVLLERAVQWTPFLFYKETHKYDELITFMSYKSVIESAINSYLNKNGDQKIFGTEIDLMYPPDSNQFYDFLASVVKGAIGWIETSREIIRSEIKLHSKDEMDELGAVAGKTNFDLKGESDLTFCEEEMRLNLSLMIEKIREIGASDEVIALLADKLSE